MRPSNQILSLHTSGTHMAHFSNYGPNFHDFGLNCSGFAFRFYVAPARASILKMTANRICIRWYNQNLYWVISHGYMTSKRYCTWFWVIWSLLYRNPQVQPSQGHIWGAEISTISQKFLDIHIRIKIPNMIHIHHFPVYGLDMAPGGSPPYRAQCIGPFQNCFIYMFLN